MSWDTAEKESKEAADLYVSLDKDGDAVIGMFLGAPAIRKQVWNEKLGKSEDYDPRMHDASARINVKFAMNFWNLEKRKVQICELTNKTFQDLIRNRDRSGLGLGEPGKFAPATFLYAIERKDKKTYVIIPATAHPVTDPIKAEWASAKLFSEEQLLGKKQVGSASANGSNGAASAATIDAATSSRLVDKIKPFGRAIVDVVLPKFGIKKVSELAASNLVAFETAVDIEIAKINAPAAAPAAPAADVDPFG